MTKKWKLSRFIIFNFYNDFTNVTGKFIRFNDAIMCKKYQILYKNKAKMKKISIKE